MSIMTKKGTSKYKFGQKFNKWTLIEHIGYDKYKSPTWLCRCNCGSEHVVTIYNVTGGTSRQCKQCSVTRNYKKDTIPTPVWKTIVNNSKTRGRVLNISKEFAENLFIKQNKKCALSGLDIYFARSNKEYVKGLQTASLDRIDNSKEYNEDNVQWVHKHINIMKNTYDENYFIELCRIITNKQIRNDR